MDIIDVHTHAYTREYLARLRTQGDPYSLKVRPNCYWGGEDTSFEVARQSNDSMAAARKKYPGRILWCASLPWEYPRRAVEELRRSMDDGICYSPQALSYLVNIVGAERVLYGTDYPHQVHDAAGMLAKTETMPPDHRHAIRAGNARRLFGI